MAIVYRAGDLRRRVKLQRRSTKLDSFGQRQESWSDVADVWADINPLSGRELEAAQAVVSATTHEITIRWRPDVTSAHRIVYRGRLFNILSALDENTQRRLLVLSCSEGLSDGR